MCSSVRLWYPLSWCTGMYRVLYQATEIIPLCHFPLLINVFSVSILRCTPIVKEKLHFSLQHQMEETKRRTPFICFANWASLNQWQVWLYISNHIYIDSATYMHFTDAYVRHLVEMCDINRRTAMYRLTLFAYFCDNGWWVNIYISHHWGH